MSYDDSIGDWARRNSVGRQALAELLALLAMPPPVPARPGARSEAAAQSEIRLRAPAWGGVLWRNNVGVWNDDGVPVRYGLANDSAKLNKHVKSSDLIGFLPMSIGYEHVGRTLAVFAGIECKPEAWRWSGSKREVAQQRFHNVVKTGGGIAGFARNAAEFDSLVQGG